MTTADFIKKTYNVPAFKDRKCSSVFTDHKGTVYSYGYHYPLAFNIAGLDFINEQGYSSSTAKHIAWARQAVPRGYIGVKLWREEAQAMSFSGYDDNKKLEFIKRALEREFTDLRVQMDSKKRKDTAIYRDLESQVASLELSLMTIEGVL